MAFKETINSAFSKWMEGTGPEGDIVVSSRVRLARNLAGVPFPQVLSQAEAEKVVHGVGLALKSKQAKKLGNLEMANLNELTPIEREILVEKHLISPQFIATPDYKAIVLRDDEAISIMVNEEDHLRIQCLFPGLQLEEAWNLANQVDDVLEKTLDYAFCEKRGYLTSCPTNVGTGLRASVMLHLPALVMSKQISRVLNALPQLGLAVRGLYGEGTEAVGNLFQISNQITLGADEEEIIKNLTGVVKQIIHQEREARHRLYEEAKPQLEDLVGRSLGTLKYAQIITSQETMRLLSDLRLGVGLNILKGISQGLINELMVLTRPAFLQKFAGRALEALERDISRAALIRAKLAQVGC